MLESLFNIFIRNHEDRQIIAEITVDADHEMYLGHFPGFALTPGVVQVEMIRQVLEKALGAGFRLSGSRNIKFPAMHRPDKKQTVFATIVYRKEEEVIKVDASLHTEDEVYVKLKGDFVEGE
jgi:3-hydroxyacyl-[acyl-carrier-protein] dehydratase